MKYYCERTGAGDIVVHMRHEQIVGNRNEVRTIDPDPIIDMMEDILEAATRFKTRVSSYVPMGLNRKSR